MKIVISPLYVLFGVVVATTMLFTFNSVLTHAASVELFHEDFEDKTLTKWGTVIDPAWTNVAGGASGAHLGSRKARVAGTVVDASLVTSFAVTTSEPLHVSVWFDTGSGWDTEDSVAVEYSTDGTSWQALGLVDGAQKTPLVEGGEEWLQKVFDIPVLPTSANTLHVRLKATITGTTDIIYFDDVVVYSGELIVPTPTVEPAISPTVAPSVAPTSVLTPVPTSIVVPTAVPTSVPTVVPTVKPTIIPTVQPTTKPTVVVTPTPEQPDEPDNDIPRFSLKELFRSVFQLFRLIRWFFWF